MACQPQTRWPAGFGIPDCRSDLPIRSTCPRARNSVFRAIGAARWELVNAKVRIISGAAGRTAACHGGLNGFNGRGNDVVRGIMAGCPGADEFLAGILRLNADL